LAEIPASVAIFSMKTDSAPGATSS
jgi:hypothetical protein